MTTKPIATITTDTRTLKLEVFSEMWPDANHELSAVLRPEEATDIYPSPSFRESSNNTTIMLALQTHL